MTTARRVLLVGWSAADWRLLTPLLDAGALPHLGRLKAEGATGHLQTLQPQLEPLLWTSLATGHRANRHEVLHTLTSSSNDSILPLTRLDRRCKALWNIAENHGHPSLVVNWPVTFPAEPLHGACVSNLFFRLAGSRQGLEAPVAGSAEPAELIDELAPLRFSPSELTAEELAFFMSDPDESLSESDALLPELTVALAESISTQAVAMEMLEKRDWNLAMVRFDILNTLGPRFMAFHPPQLPYVPQRLYERYQKTISGVLRYLDLMLGVMLNTIGKDSLVMVVSERGIHSDHLRPADPGVAFQQGGGVPWFRERGIVLLHGPGVHPGGAVQGGTLLDVAPTVLRYLDIPLARDMPGRVMVEAFEKLPAEHYIDSHETESPTGSSGANIKLNEEQERTALARWIETGLLTDGNTTGDDACRKASLQREFNRAMVYLEARRPRRALKLLEHLHQEYPDEDRVALHLARCRRGVGDIEGARKLLERVVDHPDQRPLELMQLAQLHLASGEHDRALACLFRAEQAVGERPAVHSQIGRVYLDLQRWDEAERAFTKALERDSDHAEAHRGLAAICLQQDRHDEAMEFALKAIDLDPRSPRGHHLLAKALMKKGDHRIAAQVLETCLVLEPERETAHRDLASTCEHLGEHEKAAEHLARAREIHSRVMLGRELGSIRGTSKR